MEEKLVTPLTEVESEIKEAVTQDKLIQEKRNTEIASARLIEPTPSIADEKDDNEPVKKPKKKKQKEDNSEEIAVLRREMLLQQREMQLMQKQLHMQSELLNQSRKAAELEERSRSVFGNSSARSNFGVGRFW